MKRVLIIGGGISGLATAYFLQQRARTDNQPLQCQLLERAPRFGGVIFSERVDSFVIEGGPDSFLSQKPWALELCRQLGLADQLIPSNDAQRKTFVLSGRRLVELPEGFMLMVPTKIGPFLRSPLISWPGKLRMAMDWVLPPRPPSTDESVASFVRRRLGREALEKIAEPLIGGIYSGDVERLSVKSTLPFLLDLEAQHGSIIRGLMRRSVSSTAAPGAKPSSLFTSLRGGLSDLVNALTDRLHGVTLLSGRSALALTRSSAADPASSAYVARLADGAELAADAVIIATPAPQAGALVADLHPVLAGHLKQLPYNSAATISLGYARRDLPIRLDGFGFIVPHAARRPLIACTWTSNKFPFRADAEHALVRGFVGGAHNAHLVDLDDAALVALVREELRTLMGLTAQPVLTRVFRWRQSMPEYPVGYGDRLAHIQKALTDAPGLFLVGNAYAGVGIPDCIHAAAQTVDRVVDYLRARM